MKLKDKVKPAVPPLEPGVYMAVCVVVADLGDQYSEKFKKSSRKVVFSFDIPSETIEIDGEQKPRQLSKRCTFSVSKKGTLNKMLNAWMNANMSEQVCRPLRLGPGKWHCPRGCLHRSPIPRPLRMTLTKMDLPVRNGTRCRHGCVRPLKRATSISRTRQTSRWICLLNPPSRKGSARFDLSQSGQQLQG